MKSALRIVGWLLFLFASTGSYANHSDSVPNIYKRCLEKVNELLVSDGSFKEAVFLTENVFNDTLLKRHDFYKLIDAVSFFIHKRRHRYRLSRYTESDGENYLLNRSIASTLFDTLTVRIGKIKGQTTFFSYNFDDALGKTDWANMFVSKLLVTNRGNCHSMSYMYKILADEVGAKCWLSLAPNHIYIRNYSKKLGWYNTELTSGTFPTDAWIAASGYVSTDAIRSGIYMDTLSNQQSIALCILDLAKGYEFQTRNYYDGFILKCCELVLQYHPVNPMALLLKAETLKKVYFKQAEEKHPDAMTTYAGMEMTYLTLAKLHYREMPEKMYREWLLSISKQKGKYPDKKITGSVIKKKRN